MATRTVVCPECDAPLARGRFACAACGAMLATVASGSRSLFQGGPQVADAEDSAATAEPEPANVAHATHGERAVAVAQPAEVSAALETTSFAVPAGPAAHAVPAGPAWPSTVAAPDWPDQPAWPPTPATNGSAAANAGTAMVGAVSAESLRNPAGAYLPPSAVLPPAEALPLPKPVATPPAPPAPSALADSVGSLTLPSDPAAAVISVGAGIAAVGFLLPWADVVLGSSGIGSFLDRWGLAGPGHLVIFAGLLGLSALAAFAHRLPRRLRPGLPAVGFGFLLVGLAWPYLFGPFGATVGVYVITAGGLLLGLAGSLELLLRRHAGAVASV
jgi:hypothetical protein